MYRTNLDVVINISWPWSQGQGYPETKAIIHVLAIYQWIRKLQLKWKNSQVAYLFWLLKFKKMFNLRHFGFEKSPCSQNFQSKNAVYVYPGDIPWTTQRIELRVYSDVTRDNCYKRRHDGLYYWSNFQSLGCSVCVLTPNIQAISSWNHVWGSI